MTGDATGAEDTGRGSASGDAGDTGRGSASGDAGDARPGGGFGRGPLGNGLFFGVLVGTFGGLLAQSVTGHLVALPAVLVATVVVGGLLGYVRDG